MSMKAMWFGMVAAVIIAIVAGVALDNIGGTSAERFSSADTRL